ncbi:MAG TPA: endonuclease [Lacipirellulaceae bacterium]|nr:endonuclease [Lacipirellulaceae bacterium]
MIRNRWIILAAFFTAACLSRIVRADAYDPPPTYYNTATGTGATLKQQLHNIIDGHTVMSYDAARTTLQVTDADPNQPGHMLTVYDRTSVDVSAINPGGPIPGWDSGTTWNREHTWPQSRGVGSSGPDSSDLFNLRPALTANNGDRGSLNFGGAFGQSQGVVTDGGQMYWYPGNADAGMIARQEFYMAVRYDGSDASTLDLELGAGNVANPSGDTDPPPQLGNLDRLLEWHYEAPPDSFERRRNQIIYDDYQHNRDPFTDHPEYVWSVFVNQANNSQVSILGTSVNADGSSTKTVDLGRVFVGSAVPAAQTFTLSKSGTDGTYYEVTSSGAATSSVAGRFNAFRTNQTDSASISVGLNTNTATSGLKTGAVTVDNLDITTGGGPGHGANDANDTFNISLTVLDHSTPSFSPASASVSLAHDFGNIAVGDTAPTFDFDVFDLFGSSSYTANMDFDSVTLSGDSSAFNTDLGTFAGSLQIGAGSSHTFASSLNVTSVGTFSATYTLMFSDEDLPGAQNKSLSLTLTGTVRLAGDYNDDGTVDAGDYLIWRRMFGQNGVAAYSGADGDGNTTVNQADYDVWRAHFGDTASSSGAGTKIAGSAVVPEPAGVWLMAAVLLLTGINRRRRVTSFCGKAVMPNPYAEAVTPKP